ncbi:MAG TPA: SDR family NAD(P)-dependent oxidoreductase [Isosphaeraceae bacterium]|nr:SDR family NAD(P)-dependent oxidoreductase [Isosphaeraceae bacterium]
MPRRRFNDARCLITGASSGLGRVLTQQLAQAGAQIVATGRSQERLEALVRDLEASGVPSGRVTTFAADITDDADRHRLIEAVSERFDGALDLVVQSAGVGAYGRFMSHEPSVLRQIFEINFFALAELTREVYPLLKAGKDPSMLIIGSIIARRGLPGRSEYSASKHAVAGFIEAIRAEWTRDGIHVLMVNPGFTQTEFERNLLVDTAVYKVADRRTMSADEVARRTLKALSQSKNERTFSLQGRMLLLFNRLVPRFVDWGLGRWTRKLYADHLALAEAESGSRAIANPHPGD